MKEEFLPLHLSQQDIYFDQLVHQDSPHYNTGGYIRLTGELDKKKLAIAARSVPTVFDSFTIRFDLSESVPGFFVDKNYTAFEIRELDFSHHQNPASEAARWVQQQFNIPFSLVKENLPFEQVLLKVSQNEHWFFNRYHHLITDGYGFAIWAQYIAKKYTALVTHETVHFTYPSYLATCDVTASYYTSEGYDNEKKYWASKISKPPQKLFPSRYAMLNDEGKKSGQHSFFLTKEQASALQALQAQTNFSLQQLTIAAMIIYFGKTSDEHEFIFGIPIHKRRTKHLRNTFGTFSGVLPFKGRYNESNTLIDLLQCVKSSQREDYRYQNILVSDLNRALRNSADNPLLEVIINYELLNFELDFGKELTATIAHVTSEFESNPFHICWREFGKQQALELRIDFCYEYFSMAEIELFSQRIIFILEQFPAKLENVVEEINVLPPKERDLLTVTFNKTNVTHQHEGTVVDWFEKQVVSSPDSSAVVFEDQTITYRALNERANQVARCLLTKGITSRALVPLCIERGVNMIVGVLGILKAGATYIPIDPEYPVERISFMLEDIKPSIVVGSRASRYKIPQGFNLIELDGDANTIDKESKDNVKANIQPDDLIYAIYTSGSTGTPKRAGVFHKSVVNLIQWYIREFSIASTDRNMIMSSLGFDLTQKNIFGTLLAGGTISMPAMEYYDVNQIVRCIKRHAVTIINCAPSAFYPLVDDHILFDELKSLRLVILGGEPIRLKQLRAWMEASKYACEVINSYGPTECTDIASFHRLENFDKYLHQTIPIGRPNDNVQLYVVDGANQPQPIGIHGEICIAGEGVGIGYLNDKALTSLKFVPNPFGTGTLYKTGDLGRWLPDGNVEYLGRLDDQVKVRGYRIELGEIESVLQQHDFVREAVVLLREDATYNQQLIAYVIPEGSFNRDSLLTYLKNKLPEYMVPSVVVAMESMPLTPNGKINKNALPDPEFNVSDTYIAPRNEIELKLVDIWSAVLNIDPKKISVTDNFFSLGGHSLLGVNLMAQISKAFSVEFQITILFECPEIGLLAARLAADIVKPDDAIVVAINEGTDRTCIFCVPGAGGNVISFHFLGKLLGNDQPFYAFQAPGLNGKSTPLKTVEEMASVYIHEMQKIDPYGPYILGGYSFGANVIYEMALQLKQKGFQIAKLIVFDAYEPNRNIGHVQMPGLTTDTDEQNLCRMADIFAGLYEKELNLSPVLLENKSREEQFRCIHENIQNLGIDVTPEQVKGFIEVCIANVLCTYTPENNSRLNVPVILFKPDARVAEENSWGLGREMEKDSMGWEFTTNEKVSVVNVSGDHWTLLNPPHVQEIANYLKVELGIESNNGTQILMKA